LLLCSRRRWSKCSSCRSKWRLDNKQRPSLGHLPGRARPVFRGWHLGTCQGPHALRGPAPQRWNRWSPQRIMDQSINHQFSSPLGMNYCHNLNSI